MVRICEKENTRKGNRKHTGRDQRFKHSTFTNELTLLISTECRHRETINNKTLLKIKGTGDKQKNLNCEI